MLPVAGELLHGLWQGAIGVFELLETLRAAFAKVDIQHHQARDGPGAQANIGRWLPMPPPADLGLVRRGIAEAVPEIPLCKVGMLADIPTGFALFAITADPRWGMTREDMPATGRVGESGVKQGGRRGCGHSPPILSCRCCAISVIMLHRCCTFLAGLIPGRHNALGCPPWGIAALSLLSRLEFFDSLCCRSHGLRGWSLEAQRLEEIHLCLTGRYCLHGFEPGLHAVRHAL